MEVLQLLIGTLPDSTLGLLAALAVYLVISPPTEKDLSELLRAKPLSDAEIPLIIQKNIENDDLAKRRGDIPKEEEVTFSPETISLTRPTMLIGQAAIRGAILFGRIEAESNDEEDSSPLLLTIVNPNS